VKHCETNQLELEQLSLDQYKKFSRQFADDLYDVLTLEYSVDSVKSYGGTSPQSIKLQIKKAKQEILKRDS
jgi:argininosuccinate lyase